MSTRKLKIPPRDLVEEKRIRRDPRRIGETGEVRSYVIDVRTNRTKKVWVQWSTRNGAWKAAWAHAGTQLMLGREISTITVDLAE